LKFLFILFLIFLVAPYVIRWLMPILLKSFMKRAQNQMNQQYQQKDSKKEGEVNVSQTSRTKPSGEKEKLGDYVDFEEIKDDQSK